MSGLRVLGAEVHKTVTLPAALVAAAITGPGSLAITLLNAFSVRNALQAGRSDLVGYTSAVDAALSTVPLGTVGAVVLGVVVISSEYTATSTDAGGGRSITATLTAAPRRLTVLVAKALTLLVLVATTAAVTLPACLALAHLVLGDVGAPIDPGEMVERSVGAALYWALTGLIATAITVLTRTGIVPLIVLITNSSLVSLSLLLSMVTPLARYLPDAAGIRLFARGSVAFDDVLDPLTGGLVMAAWAVGLLAVAAVVFHRRDA